MLIVVFRNFANAPKKECRHCLDYSGSVQGEVWWWWGVVSTVMTFGMTQNGGNFFTNSLRGILLNEVELVG